MGAPIRESIERYKKLVELDPTFAVAYGDLSEVYKLKHLYGEELSALQQEWNLSGDPGFARLLERAYSKSGHLGVVREELKRVLEEHTRGRYADTMSIAGYYAELGDESAAFRWLQKGYEEHSSGMEFLGVAPDFDPLRSNTRSNTGLMSSVYHPPRQPQEIRTARRCLRNFTDMLRFVLWRTIGWTPSQMLTEDSRFAI